MQRVESNISFIHADDYGRWASTAPALSLPVTTPGSNGTIRPSRNTIVAERGHGMNHNYNWWDATATFLMGPGDDGAHGTHTTGTMVGDDGGGNQIGVAPGAKTIHCKNMTGKGGGDDLTFTTCFQWDLAPGT